ncbi:MAG: thioredoxin family protein [Acidimicrobiales bacterium]|nr:thioredoxin family protein [Acidimicrobiales bacterium]
MSRSVGLAVVVALALAFVAAAPTRRVPPAAGQTLDPTAATTTVAGTAAAEPVVLELFWGDGCPHCAAEKRFLEGLAAEQPDLEVRQYEVWYDDANRDLLQDRADELGFDASGVPVTIVGDRVWIGFSDRTGEDIRAEVVSRLGGGEAATDGDGAEVSSSVEVPFVGEVDVASTSLLVATVVIGFVDGVNPCSLWVLTMLLAIVIHQGSRRRVVAVGGVFLLITTALYGFYIVGLYSVLSYVAYLGWVRVVLALVALAAGVVNLKDYLWYRQGLSLTIPDSSRPGIYRRIRLLDREPTLPAALVATSVLAVGVSLLETPCTAGFPVLWTNLLVEQGVDGAQAAGLFAVYMLVFLLDELLVFGVAVTAMRAAKLQERHGRVLKLVGGALMVAMAGVLVFAPDLLDTVGGAVAVFLLAVALAGAIALVAHLAGIGPWSGGRRRDLRTARPARPAGSHARGRRPAPGSPPSRVGPGTR